jgi:hypothetical protein
MKILLFGEFSGLHTNLKTGLKELGHEVMLVSTGDGAKKIGGDVNLSSSVNIRIFRIIHLCLKYIYFLPRLTGYDIVQYINPNILPFPHWLNTLYLKYLKMVNRQVFINICGGDAYLITFFLNHLQYSPYSNELKEGSFNDGYKLPAYSRVRQTINLVDTFDGIIASDYSYSLPYQKFKKYVGIIPFPALLHEKEIKKDAIIGKIKIFHGITRRATKGSSYILNAMERINKEYEDSIEIQIVENVAYADYLDMFDECDIFIDQACSYGYGMNALLALAKNKVVLSGNESGTNNYFDGECPIINIRPQESNIYEILRELILDKNKILRISNRGYGFVSKFHEKKIIAKKYLDSWSR